MPGTEGQPENDTKPPAGHAVIAGFGLAGRSAANALIARGVPIAVIERNIDTVRRCSIAGLRIYQGDATDEQVMRQAGIETAIFFAATMPNDPAVLEAVALARRLNPSVRIFARCEYVSTGMRAERKGADEVVVAEKVVATEFGRLVETSALVNPPTPPAKPSVADPPPPPREPSPVGSDSP
jgi:CPA2 family monovalent cation:H+ antiporter-2